MLTRETIVNRLRRDYPYLVTHYGVKRIGLFGSFAKDTANETSDVDMQKAIRSQNAKNE